MEAVGNRIEWLDVAKGIGIFFVTFAHLCPNFQIETHIYSFHMFFFFLLSGFLYKHPDNPNEFAKKRVKSLLAPFLFWNVVGAVFDILVNHTDLGTIVLKFFMINGDIGFNAPIWFLFTLFLTEMLYMAVHHYSKEEDEKWLLIASAAIGFLMANQNVTFKLGIVPVAYLFYSIGAVAKKYADKIKPNVFAIIAALAVNIAFGVIMNIRISVIVCSYGNYLNCLIAGISGIALYIMLSQLISAKPKLKLASRLFSYLGKNTVPIMCMQYLFFGTYNLICMDLLGHNESIGSMRSTIKAFALSVITIFMILMIAQIIKKIKLKPLMTVFGVKDSNENAS